MKRKFILTTLVFVTLFIPLSVFSQSQDFEMNGTVLRRYRGNATNVSIPEGVTAIGRRAFSDIWDITSVTIPLSVTFIGERAFDRCRSLTSVTISRRTTIGNNAFPATAQITYSD